MIELVRLAGKIVLVTGAGSGIGRATAILCAREGARVIAADISLEPASGQLAVQADVSDSEQVQAMVQRAIQEYGTIDVLFNNAGIAVRQTVAEQSEQDWDRVIQVNVRSVFLCSKYTIPHMMARGGSIINMASVVGITGVRNRAAYSTSKGAIVALTRNMALDYAQYGIRVNCVCPGFTETPLTRGLLSNPAAVAKLTALHPLGRLGRPEDIAAAVLFLASDEAAWITGVALPVDGGFTAGHATDV
ncbi:MAG: SDR family oxidoreductase [Acidobacteriia bacterium]|nr:SDR family oxidoreductase [Terriglobia bacterium]